METLLASVQKKKKKETKQEICECMTGELFEFKGTEYAQTSEVSLLQLREGFPIHLSHKSETDLVDGGYLALPRLLK